jgi:hypothetical protein
MTAVRVRFLPLPPVSLVDSGPDEQADSDAVTAADAPSAPVYFRNVRRCSAGTSSVTSRTVPPAR